MTALQISNFLATTDKLINETKILSEKARHTKDGVTEIDRVLLHDVYEHLRVCQRVLLHILGTTEV